MRFINSKEGDTGGAFRRGFSINPGEPVLIVDDIPTTGQSINQVMAAVTNQGGTVVGIGVLVDRSQQRIHFAVPFFSCHRAITPTYTPESCPMCTARLPLVKPGGS